MRISEAGIDEELDHHGRLDLRDEHKYIVVLHGLRHLSEDLLDISKPRNVEIEREELWGQELLLNGELIVLKGELEAIEVDHLSVDDVVNHAKLQVPEGANQAVLHGHPKEVVLEDALEGDKGAHAIDIAHLAEARHGRHDEPRKEKAVVRIEVTFLEHHRQQRRCRNTFDVRIPCGRPEVEGEGGSERRGRRVGQRSKGWRGAESGHVRFLKDVDRVELDGERHDARSEAWRGDSIGNSISAELLREDSQRSIVTLRWEEGGRAHVGALDDTKWYDDIESRYRFPIKIPPHGLIKTREDGVALVEVRADMVGALGRSTVHPEHFDDLFARPHEAGHREEQIIDRIASLKERPSQQVGIVKLDASLGEIGAKQSRRSEVTRVKRFGGVRDGHLGRLVQTRKNL